MGIPLPAIFLLLLVALATAGCGGGAAAGGRPLHLVALGDSLAVGVQPGLDGEGRVTSQGYPRQLAALLRDRGRDVELHELGCGGATAESLIEGGLECAPDAGVPYAGEDPGTSQLTHAVGLLSRLHGQQVVVTLDIGGNDVGACLQGGTLREPCLAATAERVGLRIGQALRSVRAAAPDAPVLVLDVYDPALGLWPRHPEARPALRRIHALLTERVAGAIADAVADGGATLVPLGALLRQDTPLDDLSAPQPPAVAAVCEHTWMCVSPPLSRDIHLRRSGHRLAAEAILARLPANVRGAAR